MRTLVLYLVVLSSLQAQSFKKLRYLGDIGYLGTDLDPRKSVNLGAATVYAADEDSRFEGIDNFGRRWTAMIPTQAGIGFTDVWSGDFDGNGHPDLMIARLLPRN